MKLIWLDDERNPPKEILEKGFIIEIVEHNTIGFFHLHSMNFVGRKNICHLLTHYGWKQYFF